MRYCPACHSVFPNEFRTCPRDQSELRTASDLQPGMVLRGKYEVLDKVGAGGMASVYRARHLAFNEVCAIKVVAGRLSDDDDFLRRFRNEAVVARRFQHLHAVRVDDLDTTEDGRPFIVMEYVEGPNLREVVRREGPLGLRRALTIARQVASALSAAHALGIVHRDIKPDNILLAGTGAAESAKVLDFGIAKVKEGFFGDGDHVATRTGAVVGTPQYISPEQALGRRGDELDGRADLYSLGVVLYEMVTGRLPFESDTAMGIILHHLQTMPTPPHEVRPDLGIPAPLSAVLLRMLDKDRDRRFATASDLMAALDEVLALPLPERAAVAADGAMDHGRPATPRPVPMDIDRQETRVMPRTPPITTTVRTPIPASTVHIPLPIPGTPLPRATPPPPLPSASTNPPPRRRGGRPGWLKWAGIGLALFFVSRACSERPDRKSARTAEPSPAPQAELADGGAPADDDRIESEVEKVLEDDPETHDEAISVKVAEGQVTLRGHVHKRELAEEADRLARTVAGVAGVSNEIELRAPGDHRSKVPPSEVVLAVPKAAAPAVPQHPVLPAFPEAALKALTHDLPIAQLVRQGQESMKAGDAESAMGAFTAALSLDPTNRDAAQGARDAARALRDKARAEQPRGSLGPQGPGGPRGPQPPLPSPPPPPEER